jgi:hypothetical protein
MDPRSSALQTLVAIESESRDLIAAMESESRDQAPSPMAETDMDIAGVIQKLGATSIAEIEKLVDEMQEAKTFLQSEEERIQQEAARYMNQTQAVSESAKIIFRMVSAWRKAGYPARNLSRSSGFEMTPSPAEDNT